MEIYLKEIEGRYSSLIREIGITNDRAIELESIKDDVELQILALRKKIADNSGELDKDARFYLFQDLNKIHKMCSVYEEEDDSFTLELKYNEGIDKIYSVEVIGDNRKCHVTIQTRSKKVLHIVRQCFNNEGHHYEDDSLIKADETMWFNGPYDCCSRSFTFNKDLAKSLLHVDNTDRGRGRGRSR